MPGPPTREPARFRPDRRRRRGLTLVEMMIALFIFALLAAGVVSGMIQLKWNAENNLYEASSMNVAISALEQMKAINYTALEAAAGGGAATFPLFIDNGSTVDVGVGANRTLEIPIVSEEDGEVRMLAVDILLEIEPCTDFQGYWLEVAYTWRHPRTDKQFGGSVKGMRSIVSTF